MAKKWTPQVVSSRSLLSVEIFNVPQVRYLSGRMKLLRAITINHCDDSFLANDRHFSSLLPSHCSRSLYLVDSGEFFIKLRICAKIYIFNIKHFALVLKIVQCIIEFYNRIKCGHIWACHKITNFCIKRKLIKSELKTLEKIFLQKTMQQ